MGNCTERASHPLPCSLLLWQPRREEDLFMEEIERIWGRQLARFLNHLKKTGQATPELECDVKRAYRYVFEDVETYITSINGHDEEEQR